VLEKKLANRLVLGKRGMNVVSLKKHNISFFIQQMELQATWQVAYMLSYHVCNLYKDFGQSPPKKGITGLSYFLVLSL
jgi:hypothetical protein